MRANNRGRFLTSLLFITPALALMFTFLLYPVVLTLVYSLTNWDGISATFSFVGLRNFFNVVTDPVFPQLILNTVVLAVLYVPVLNLVAFVLSVLVYDMVRGQGFAKALLFFPNLLSMVVVGFIWMLMFAFNNGLINSVLRSLGLGRLAINWLGVPNVVLLSLSTTIIWFATGFYMLIYLAGLGSVSTEVFEATDMDGAGWLTKHVRVTLPMIAASVKTNVILSTIGLLGLFDLPYIMTKGGPVHYSETLAVRVYYYAFKELQQGKGMALAIILTVTTMAITLVMLNTGRRGEAA
jgi:ABC-type sugar transport system permease subunit